MVSDRKCRLFPYPYILFVPVPHDEALILRKRVEAVKVLAFDAPPAELYADGHPLHPPILGNSLYARENSFLVDEVNGQKRLINLAPDAQFVDDIRQTNAVLASAHAQFHGLSIAENVLYSLGRGGYDVYINLDSLNQGRSLPRNSGRRFSGWSQPPPSRNARLPRPPHGESLYAHYLPVQGQELPVQYHYDQPAELA